MNKFVGPLINQSLHLPGDMASSTTTSPPIDLVAMILQVETLEMVTKIDMEDDHIIEETSLTPTPANNPLGDGHWKPGHWESYWSDRVRIEATVRVLNAALASKQWTKGRPSLAELLVDEHLIILNRLQSQGDYIREGVQQINAVTSIQETRRGMKQSDSVRR